MTRTAAKTGPGPMVLVAIEQAFSESSRIVTDDLALPILPAGQRITVRLMRRIRNWLVRKSDERVPGLWGGIMARKRYIDDRAADARAEGVEALVNLGAGFDTRAYRLPELADLPTWEIDEPGNIAAKKTRLEKLFRQVPAHVTLVPIDFDREHLGQVLEKNGYDFASKTLFIWEGVTQYLTEAGVQSTFEVLDRAPPGSRLLFTYTPVDFIEGRTMYGQRYLYRQMIEKARLWHFGFAPTEVEGFLAGRSWRMVEHLGYDELATRYVRPTGRTLAAMKIERIVYAEKN